MSLSELLHVVTVGTGRKDRNEDLLRHSLTGII